MVLQVCDAAGACRCALDVCVRNNQTGLCGEDCYICCFGLYGDVAGQACFETTFAAGHIRAGLAHYFYSVFVFHAQTFCSYSRVPREGEKYDGVGADCCSFVCGAKLFLGRVR